MDEGERRWSSDEEELESGEEEVVGEVGLGDSRRLGEFVPCFRTCSSSWEREMRVARKFERRGKWSLGLGGSGEVFCCSRKRRSRDDGKTSRWDGRDEEVEIETLGLWMMRRRMFVPEAEDPESQGSRTAEL